MEVECFTCMLMCLLLSSAGVYWDSRAITIHFTGISSNMARGWYLKYFQRFKRKILVSTTHWNAGIKCLKVKANLWLLHPIHFSNGTLCSKCLFSPFFLPELTFVVSIQTKRAWWRFISSLTKNFSSSGIILTDDKWAPNSLLVGIRPMKCLEIDWFL